MEKNYIKHFEGILLLCPTFEWNRTYQEWKYKNDHVFIDVPYDQDNIGTVLRNVVDLFKGTNGLITVDHCASGQKIKNRTSEVIKLNFSARHYGLSTIIIMEQLTSVAKPYRKKVSYPLLYC